MRRRDYFGQGSRGWLRLHEKGGRRHDVPAHHRAAAVLEEYVEVAGLEEPKAALFQSVDPAGRRLRGRVRGFLTRSAGFALVVIGILLFGVFISMNTYGCNLGLLAAAG